MLYLFSWCKHRWHVTSKENQKAKNMLQKLTIWITKSQKNKQTNEMKYMLLFHLSFFGFLFRSLASFVVGKFIRAQVFEQSLENTTIKTRIGLKIIVQELFLWRVTSHTSLESPHSWQSLTGLQTRLWMSCVTSVFAWLVARRLGRDQLINGGGGGDSISPLPLTSSFCFLLSLQFSDRTNYYNGSFERTL